MAYHHHGGHYRGGGGYRRNDNRGYRRDGGYHNHNNYHGHNNHSNYNGNYHGNGGGRWRDAAQQGYQRAQGGTQRFGGAVRNERRSWGDRVSGAIQSYRDRNNQPGFVGRRIQQWKDDREFKKRSQAERDARLRQDIIRRHGELDVAAERGRRRMDARARKIENYCVRFPNDCKNYKKMLSARDLNALNAAKGIEFEERARLRQAKRAHNSERFYGAPKYAKAFGKFIIDDVKYATNVPQTPVYDNRVRGYTPSPQRYDYSPMQAKNRNKLGARARGKDMDDMDASFRYSVGL